MNEEVWERYVDSMKKCDHKDGICQRELIDHNIHIEYCDWCAEIFRIWTYDFKNGSREWIIKESE